MDDHLRALYAHLYPEDGPVALALNEFHHDLNEEVILDPEAPPSGPRGRGGRLPSSGVIRRYVARLAELARRVEREEAELQRLENREAS
jgi:hypothetical protein